MRVFSTIFFSILFICISPLHGDIIHVPANLPTIQAGIDFSSSGDTVLVAEGTYVENISYNGKAVTVASHFIMDNDTIHIVNTIIDGSQPGDPNLGSVVRFVDGEGPEAVLCGFTITGGSGSRFESNRRGGGGIFIYNARPTISFNYIEYNVLYNDAPDFAMGGGIYAGPLNANGPIEISGNVIRFNSAEGVNGHVFGGGICISIPGEIVGNRIHDNTAKYSGNGTGLDGLSFGGGISCYNQIVLRLIAIRDNIIANNRSISNNTAYSGAVDFLNFDCDFSGNMVTNNTIEGVNGNFGGAIRYFNSSASTVIKNNTFSFNRSQGGVGGWGGALLPAYTFDMTIEDNLFIGNEAASGAGIRNDFAENTRIIHNEFMNNSGEDGGAIYDSESTGTLITRNKFIGNNAGNGGAIRINGVHSSLQNNLFSANSATSGGALSIASVNDSPAQDHSANHAHPLAWPFADNITEKSESNRAELSKTLTHDVAVINNTFTGNIANGLGGAIYSIGSNVTVVNSIFWGDSASSAGAEVFSSLPIEIHYSNFDGDKIQGTWNGGGNINADPLFNMHPDSLYHLTSESPCIDSGVDSLEINGHWYYVPLIDLNGMPRPISLASDIGAFEWPITDISLMPNNLANSFRLEQNYPNPFNPATTIEFSLPKAGFVSLTVYNTLGQAVAELVAERLPVGNYRYAWNAQGLASGVYFYKLSSAQQTIVKKALLLK